MTEPITFQMTFTITGATEAISLLLEEGLRETTWRHALAAALQEQIEMAGVLSDVVVSAQPAISPANNPGPEPPRGGLLLEAEAQEEAWREIAARLEADEGAQAILEALAETGESAALLHWVKEQRDAFSSLEATPSGSLLPWDNSPQDGRIYVTDDLVLRPRAEQSNLKKPALELFSQAAVIAVGEEQAILIYADEVPPLVEALTKAAQELRAKDDNR
jgi:hypothetical protein